MKHLKMLKKKGGIEMTVQQLHSMINPIGEAYAKGAKKGETIH